MEAGSSSTRDGRPDCCDPGRRDAVLETAGIAAGRYTISTDTPDRPAAFYERSYRARDFLGRHAGGLRGRPEIVSSTHVRNGSQANPRDGKFEWHSESRTYSRGSVSRLLF